MVLKDCRFLVCTQIFGLNSIIEHISYLYELLPHFLILFRVDHPFPIGLIQN